MKRIAALAALAVLAAAPRAVAGSGANGGDGEVRAPFVGGGITQSFRGLPPWRVRSICPWKSM